MPIISLDLMVAVSFLLIWGLVADIKLCDRRSRRTIEEESSLE